MLINEGAHCSWESRVPSIRFYFERGPVFFPFLESLLASNLSLGPLMCLVRVVRGKLLGHHSILCLLLCYIWFELSKIKASVFELRSLVDGYSWYASIPISFFQCQRCRNESTHALNGFFKVSYEILSKIYRLQCAKFQIKLDSDEYYRNYIYLCSPLGLMQSVKQQKCEAFETCLKLKISDFKNLWSIFILIIDCKNINRKCWWVYYSKMFMVSPKYLFYTLSLLQASVAKLCQKYCRL